MQRIYFVFISILGGVKKKRADVDRPNTSFSHLFQDQNGNIFFSLFQHTKMFPRKKNCHKPERFNLLRISFDNGCGTAALRMPHKPEDAGLNPFGLCPPFQITVAALLPQYKGIFLSLFGATVDLEVALLVVVLTRVPPFH